MRDNAPLPHSSVRIRLEYPCGEAPVPGLAREVAPGVLWVRMPLPSTLDHINLWVVRGAGGWAVFDTGMQTSDTADAWRRLCDSGGALAVGGIKSVLITHMHPDHVGMAGWLTRKFDCPLLMTRLEYLTCRVLVADTGREAPKDGVNFYRRAGWNDAALESYRTRFGGFGKWIYALPDSYRRLRDQERLPIGDFEWRVIVVSGHSPEHACFYNEGQKLLISGDQVLPKITSNVSLFPTEPNADPLGEWLDSIAKLRREVPDDVLVLPSHNEPFRGLHARLEYLADHHTRALDRLRTALEKPRRAIDVFASLFSRPINSEPELLGMATGESLAHLNYLVHRGEVIKDSTTDTVDWYRLK